MALTIFKLLVRDKVHERESTCGGMDSEPTGNVYQEERDLLVAAENLEMTRAWWNHCYSPGGCNGVIVKEEEIGPLCGVVQISNNGRF